MRLLIGLDLSFAGQVCRSLGDGIGSGPLGGSLLLRQEFCIELACPCFIGGTLLGRAGKFALVRRDHRLAAIEGLLPPLASRSVEFRWQRPP